MQVVMLAQYMQVVVEAHLLLAQQVLLQELAVVLVAAATI